MKFTIDGGGFISIDEIVIGRIGDDGPWLLKLGSGSGDAYDDVGEQLVVITTSTLHSTNGSGERSCLRGRQDIMKFVAGRSIDMVTDVNVA